MLYLNMPIPPMEQPQKANLTKTPGNLAANGTTLISLLMGKVTGEIKGTSLNIYKQDI